MNKQITLEQFKSKKAGIAIVILLHIVGAAGFLSPLSDWFVFLTPVNIILTAGMLWIDTKPNSSNAFLIIFTIWLIGYTVEILGVKTGFPFGEYTYGTVLGWKFFEAPPLIGVNWLLVVWGGYSLVFSLGVSKYFRWIAAALLITALDFLIEPVAVHFGFWNWQNSAPPLQNYIAWFLIACFQVLLFEKYPLVQKPRLGVTAFICQLLFFGVLYLRIS